MRAKLVAALAGALVLGVLGLSPASAGQDEPPKVPMRRGGEVIQRGTLNSYCWRTGDQGMCVDRIGTWPQRIELPSDTKVKLRIKWDRKPTNVSVSTYEAIGDMGFPEGEQVFLDHRLVAFRRDGQVVAWDVLVTLPGPRQHYLELFAGWEDKGDGFWHYNVRTR